MRQYTLIQMAAAQGQRDARDGVGYFSRARYVRADLQRAYNDAYATTREVM